MDSARSDCPWSEDEQAIVALLQSMGVTEFDPSVPAALNEYAKRYASEVISDAKDYSVYIGKKEIDADDVRLSLKLSESRISGVDSKVDAIDEIKEVINRQPLESLLSNIPTSIRSLPLVGEHRSFTLIPGSEAYSHYVATTTSNQNQN